jgi:hypothetical protein
MNADGLMRVTKALRLRLEQVVGAGKVFVGPLDDPDAVGASLILFLYRIMPNPSLRNCEHRVTAEVAPPPVVVFRNALPLDLYFLLTVGTNPGGSEEALLQTLGEAMLALQLDPEITGPLVGYETVHVTLEPLSTEEAGRIWALFPTANYRTTVAYLASPVWIDPKLPASVGAPVVKDSLDAGARVSFERA